MAEVSFGASILCICGEEDGKSTELEKGWSERELTACSSGSEQCPNRFPHFFKRELINELCGSYHLRTGPNSLFKRELMVCSSRS